MISPLLSLHKVYEDELRKHVIPFWENHSLDQNDGGFFTCLDRKGRVYDTDKFMWLQWRQIWMFSRLYNRLDRLESWRMNAELGLRFAAKFGRDRNGQHYFSMTRTGEPLTHSYNIYTECFAALAWCEYSKITDRDQERSLARSAFTNFIERRANPKGNFSKQTSVRPLQGFGSAMMSAYLAFEMEDIVGDAEAEMYYDQCIKVILQDFYDPVHGVIRENINPDGSYSDSMNGRLVNPGHGLEAMWFLLDIAERTGRHDIMDRVCQIIIEILEFSWDQIHGGIYYFMDVKGLPLQQLEHDQKLWWVHLEALIALSRALRLRPSPIIKSWFLRVHEYTFTHFPDHEHGEWFGYLSRQGQPHSDLKGGKWKGCFHVPRGLLECMTDLKQIAAAQNLKLH